MSKNIYEYLVPNIYVYTVIHKYILRDILLLKKL